MSASTAEKTMPINLFSAVTIKEWLVDGSKKRPEVEVLRMQIPQLQSMLKSTSARRTS